MVSLTPKEREALLILFKDFTIFYNANSISKVLQISHVGAQKILKRLLQENIMISKTIGKSITYKVNCNEDYVCQLLSFLLADEANHFKRWKEEFKELFEGEQIVVLFGSTVKNYAHAQDIDIMVILEHNNIKEVNEVLKKKKGILPKKIHSLKLTAHDLLENLTRKDKAMVDIVKNGIVLYGQDKYIEIMKHVTSL